MKLVANIQLQPTAKQNATLRQTLKQANEACNWLSERAWKERIFGQYNLHGIAYHECRGRFGLSAQVTVRCIAKVADAYNLDCKRRCQFRWNAAQPYDDRIFRLCNDDRVSIWTLDGRQKIPFVCGERQRKLLAYRKGEVDLMYVRKRWYIACVCDVPEPEKTKIEDVLGVDFGIVNIAFDSDGNCYSGKAVEDNRRKYAHRRRNLQRKGTRAATRKLRQISGKQARYQKDVNHCISKTIVNSAQRTGRGIALEELRGIRGRVTARRRQRSRLANWSFFQLRSFVEYKAQLSGVPLETVDPRNTSRECPACGHIAKANRVTRDRFECRSCGFAGPADHIAALNIRFKARAAVNQPMVASGGCVLHLAPQLQSPSLG